MRWNLHQKKIQKHHQQAPAYKNPLFAKKTWQLYVIQRIGLISWLTILALIVFIYFIFYSPLLQITKVEIKGTVDISPTTIKEKMVDWQMQQGRWVIFKQNNLVLFDQNWLVSNINQEYPIESINITKDFPNTLVVSIVEKKPEFVWVSNGQYYYISSNGLIDQKIENSEPAASLPHINDESNEEISTGQEVLNEQKLSFFKELNIALIAMPSVNIIAYSVPNIIVPQINVSVEEGYQIFFETNKSLEQQINKLKRIIEEGTIIKENPQEYVDLRIGDRVYIK